MEEIFVPRLKARLGGKMVMVDPSLIRRDGKGRERVAIRRGDRDAIRYTLASQLTSKKTFEA